jgi:hypothetical protein
MSGLSSGVARDGRGESTWTRDITSSGSNLETVRSSKTRLQETERPTVIQRIGKELPLGMLLERRQWIGPYMRG